MTTSPFASLHAGLLARKGAAAPSVENWIPFRPRAEPAPAQTSARADERPATPVVVHPATHHPLPQAAASADTGHAALLRSRASVRLTHEQLRALKLAALLLDRPQQDLIAAGVDLRLEDLACGPLEHCACFRAVIQQLTKD